MRSSVRLSSWSGSCLLSFRGFAEGDGFPAALGTVASSWAAIQPFPWCCGVPGRPLIAKQVFVTSPSRLAVAFPHGDC